MAAVGATCGICRRPAASDVPLWLERPNLRPPFALPMCHDHGTLCMSRRRMLRVTRAIIAGACGRTAAELYSDLATLAQLKVWACPCVPLDPSTQDFWLLDTQFESCCNSCFVQGKSASKSSVR